MPFKGKEMFLWNLEKCISLFDRVYVSSDSYHILKLATMNGALAIHRGEDLCGDVPDIPVYQHALSKMRDVFGIVAVHANNPTIEKNLIALVKKHIEMGIPEVMTCHPITHEVHYKSHHHKINGSIRGMTVERLTNYGDPYKPKPEILVVDRSTEIETLEDFNEAHYD